MPPQQLGRFRLSDLDPAPVPAPKPLGRFRLEDLDPLDELLRHTPAADLVGAPRAPIAPLEASHAPTAPTAADPGAFRRWTRAADTPLVPALATGAASLADRVAAPGGRVTNVLDALAAAALPGTRPGEARGFAAGALQGAGDLAAGFTSPLEIAATLATLGANKTVSATTQAGRSISRTLRAAEGALAAPIAIEGALSAAEAAREGQWVQALAGVGQAAGGLAGQAHAGRELGALPAGMVRPAARAATAAGTPAPMAPPAPIGTFPASALDPILPPAPQPGLYVHAGQQVRPPGPVGGPPPTYEPRPGPPPVFAPPPRATAAPPPAAAEPPPAVVPARERFNAGVAHIFDGEREAGMAWHGFQQELRTAAKGKPTPAQLELAVDAYLQWDRLGRAGLPRFDRVDMIRQAIGGPPKTPAERLEMQRKYADQIAEAMRNRKPGPPPASLWHPPPEERIGAKPAPPVTPPAPPVDVARAAIEEIRRGGFVVELYDPDAKQWVVEPGGVTDSSRNDLNRGKKLRKLSPTKTVKDAYGVLNSLPESVVDEALAALDQRPPPIERAPEGPKPVTPQVPTTHEAPPVVDTLSTGEKQPRLPGEVGQVRDLEVPDAGAGVKLPPPDPEGFSLSGGRVHDPANATDRDLFGAGSREPEAPKGPTPEQLREQARQAEQARYDAERQARLDAEAARQAEIDAKTKADAEELRARESAKTGGLLDEPVPARFEDNPAVVRRELRNALKELEEFSHQRREYRELTSQEAGGGKRDHVLTPTQSNAPIYHTINEGKGRTNKQLRAALEKYINGTGRGTGIITDIVRAARLWAYDLAGGAKRMLPDDAGAVPGELYVRPKRIGKPDQARELATIARVDREGDALREQYADLFGRVFNDDNAGELFEPHEGGRWAHREADRSSAKALVDDMFARALEEPVDRDADVVVFMAGGPGSGKSTHIDPAEPNLHSTLDTPLDNYPVANAMVNAALRSGRMVDIRMVYADPVTAYVDRVARRLDDPADGRQTPIAEHAQQHADAVATVLRLAEDHATDMVTVQVIDNSGPTPVVRDLDWLKEQQARYDDPQAIAARIREALADEVSSRRLTPDQARRLEQAGTDQPARDEGGPGSPGRRGQGRYTAEDLDDAEADGPGGTSDGAPHADAPQGAKPKYVRPELDRPQGPGEYFGRPLSESETVRRMQRIFSVRDPSILQQLGGRVRRDLPVRVGRHPLLRSKALGLYFPNDALIRLQTAGSLSTFNHELGHHFDFDTFEKVGHPVGLFKSELLQLGAATTPPGKPKKYQLAEGVAEFFREWFDDGDQARKLAPQFAAALDDVMKNTPVFAQQLREAQQLVGRYRRQPVDVRGAARVNTRPAGLRGRIADVRAEMASNPERGSFRSRFVAALRDTGNMPETLADVGKQIQKFKLAWVDKHQATRDAILDYVAGGGKHLPASLHGYVLSRLADKSPAMAEAMLEHGPRGLDGTFLGPGLNKVLQPVHDRLYPNKLRPQDPDLLTYLVALRARELHTDGKGRNPGLKPREADAIIRRTEADPDFARLEKARDGVYSYLSGLRHYAHQYGAFSSQQLAALEDAMFYIPLQRILDHNDNVGSVEPGSAKYANRQDPTKKLKGSGRDIIDPIESIVRNTFALVAFVERNRAAAAIAHDLGDPRIKNRAGALLQRIQTPEDGTKFNLKDLEKQIYNAIDQAGMLDPDFKTARKLGQLEDMFDQLVTVYTPTAFGKPGERILFVLDQGKRVFYQVQDEALYTTLVGLGPSTTSQVMKLAGKAANVLRAGTTSRPTFVVRNLLRDTVGALFQSRHGFIPIYDSARGFLSQLKQDDDYKRFMSFGLQQATLLGNDRNALRSAIGRATAPPPGLASKLFKPITSPLQFLQEFSSAVETATRLGEFKLALESGGQERRTGLLGIAQRLVDTKKGTHAIDEDVLTKAALAAADVTVDFSRGGTYAKDLSTVATFFNARVQGYVRVAETIKRDPVGAATTAAALAGLSAVLWEWNKDDPDYAEIDAQRKRDYWFIKLPGTEHYLTIAKPFVWSSVANMTEEALEEARRTDPGSLHPLRDFVRTAGGDFVMSVAPTIVLPTLEVLANWAFYRDRPPVAPHLRGLEPDLQVNDWTSDSFRALGHALDVSPALLEHWARQTAGGAVGDVAQFVDPVAGLTLRGKAATRAQGGVERIPGVAALITPKRTDSRAMSVERFYDRFEEIDGARKSHKKYLAGLGQRAAAQYLQELNETWSPAFVSRMIQTKPAIDKLREEIDEVEGGTLSPAEKRTRVDALHRQLAKTARFALEGK